MRHDALQCGTPHTSLRSELATYLSVSGSHLSMAQAAALAVRAWIAADRAQLEAARCAGHAELAGQRGIGAGAGAGTSPATSPPASPAASPPARGYLWKTVFLPHGSQLRMQHAGRTYLAEVQGDQIIFNGTAVSPRGMTLAITGAGRNAWRDLVVRLPGERFWKAASRLRRDSKASSAQQLQAPPTALSSAALALADAFVSALALGAPAESLPRTPAPFHERRTAKHQRKSDTYQDYCDFD